MREQRVLILGGTGGMGLATAKTLSANNFEVVIAGRNKEKLISASKALGDHSSFSVFDASNESELKSALIQHRGVDHIIVAISANANARGINNTLEMEARKAFERFWTSYNVLHLAPEYMNRNGSVTLLSGSSAKTPLRGYGVWGTLHGSINALVKQAAIDIAPIRVNAVSPGGIGINTDRQLTEHKGQVEDIADMIYAVIKNPAVTATIIDVDGGERLGTWNG
ncbi:SDR family oxidoreductase [Poritiphilus flavus]|uniref:SDR family oxidoreductase n=1 Tax=Poritiphilus flavus TaxID=2697053 RepID=A0A6L9EGJ9_9FLAO|nr:SDR family oxidoreductase [Poritiphilus flavus]NAS13884.1 SDR family oxidoreductase [Poritiphilus flavus]